MKKFVLNVIVFLVPIVIFFAIIEVLTRFVPNTYSKKSDYLDTNMQSIEVLILGNSHAYYGLNPEKISRNAYNAAFVSQTLDIDYEFLKHYDKKLESLHTVVLRLSYFSLFEQLGKTDEDWRISSYNLYTDLTLDHNLKHHFNVLSIKLNNNLSVIYDYYVKDIDKVDCNDHGQGIFPKFNGAQSSFTLEEAGAIAAKRHTISDQSLVTFNTHILETIILFCKERHIKVLLYTPPAYKSYVEALNKEQLRTTIEIGQNMEKKHLNVRYYNYLNNGKFDAADFFDGDHLNEMGADKFSLMIADDIDHNLFFRE